MHSHADSVIAFWHGQKMFDLANQPKQAFWAVTPDHNEMDLVKGYDEAIQRFAATLGNREQQPPPPVPAPRVP
jgi:hypothetical protein